MSTVDLVTRGKGALNNAAGNCLLLDDDDDDEEDDDVDVEDEDEDDEDGVGDVDVGIYGTVKILDGSDNGMVRVTNHGSAMICTKVGRIDGILSNIFVISAFANGGTLTFSSGNE